ncbi:hypothetical protein TruAng_012211 [Truncatella angustata]|nr:hypothetical protein TruAng_012211 [Truncatella angustata]
MEQPDDPSHQIGSLNGCPEKSTGRLVRIIEEYPLDKNAGVNSQQRHIFDPVMPGLQTAASRWLDAHFPHGRQKTLLFLSLFLTWLLAFAVLSDRSMALTKVDGAYQPVRQLSCTDSLWLPGNGCGQDGENCPATSKPMAFRCPANCASVKLQEPHLVGSQRIVNQPLAIGGPVYRADSWICASAVHFGIVDDAKGGCGVLSRMGQTNTFPGSRMNGIVSVAVRTYFPQSFKFQFDSGFECHSKEQSRMLPYISIAFTMVVFLFSNTPLLPFCVAIGTGLMHSIALLGVGRSESDAPTVQSGSPNFRQTLITATIQYAPVLLCATLIYRHVVRRTLSKVAPIEKTVLWLGSFWVGLIISHDLQQKIFAVPSLVALVALHQMYYLHEEGTLPRSLALYAASLSTLAISLAFRGVPAHLLPLAFLLLPGTAVLTRPNLAYQGLLAGLLVQGLAQRGIFYSVEIFTTPTSAVDLSVVAAVAPPEVLKPVIHLNDASSNITFTWRTPVPIETDGISMLINDVERARYSFASQESDRFEWVRTPQAVPDFVRFSWVKESALLGYGDAGIWKADGFWTGIGGADISRDAKRLS